MAALIHPLEVSSISGRLHCETSGRIVTNPNHRALRSAAILKHHGKGRGRVRIGVISSIKEPEVRVSVLEQSVMSYGQFSAPVKRGSSKQSKEDEEKQKQNYYVNTGNAIRTLREEFPELFYRELSFDIYRFEL